MDGFDAAIIGFPRRQLQCLLLILLEWYLCTYTFEVNDIDSVWENNSQYEYAYVFNVETSLATVIGLSKLNLGAGNVTQMGTEVSIF